MYFSKTTIALLLPVLFACEGLEGDIGPDGLKSLINATNIQSGPDCPAGGVKIETGVDANNDNILASDEIDNSVFVCNGQTGADGLQTLLKMTEESESPNCINGGYKIESGLDSNVNGNLDSDEINYTSFICDGQDDYLSYVATINQTGTNPPSGTEIKNTLDLTIVWTRTAQGKFKGSLNKNMDLNKTVLLSNNNNVLASFTASDEITLQNACGVNAYCDDFSSFFIEIRFFN